MPRLLALLLLLAASGPEEALAPDDLRVAKVAWRLQTAGVGLCRQTVPLTGMTLHAVSQYDPGERDAVASRFRLDAGPAVLSVVPGSAAARAGLRGADRLTAIDGTPVVGSRIGPARYDDVAAAEDALDTALARAPAELRVERGGQAVSVRLTGTPGCASRVQLVPGQALTAEADGRFVQLSAAVLAFARSDDELAAILAHELAHNFLAHRKRLDRAGIRRGLLAGLGSNGRMLRAIEDEADALSVELVARAGYDVRAIVPFWTRFARKTGHGIFSDGTHASWRNRIARMAAAVALVRPPVTPPQQSASQPEIPR